MYISTGMVIIIVFYLLSRERDARIEEERYKADAPRRDWIDSQIRQKEQDEFKLTQERWDKEDLFELDQEKSFKEAIDKILNTDV